MEGEECCARSDSVEWECIGSAKSASAAVENSAFLIVVCVRSVKRERYRLSEVSMQAIPSSHF